MAVMTNQANLTYTYGTTTATVASNVAETVWNAGIAAEKRALESVYREGSTLTYLISLTNAGAAAAENLVITDNLGAFTPAGASAPVVPLTFSGNAALYLNGAFSEALTPAIVPGGVQFTIPSVPAGADALLICQTTVNGFAPLEAGSEITNTATVGDEPIAVSATVPVADYADVSIEKAMEPNPITDGSELTVTFTIENRGNTEATGLVLTDDFPLSLSNPAVTVNGATVTAFTFVNNLFTLPAEGSATTLSVPAATFTQDETGLTVVTPGVLQVILTGTV